MLLNDVCRCEGDMHLPTTGRWLCEKRESCARYVERNTGGERTPHGQYLCDDGDMFIPVENQHEKR